MQTDQNCQIQVDDSKEIYLVERQCIKRDTLAQPVLVLQVLQEDRHIASVSHQQMLSLNDRKSSASSHGNLEENRYFTAVSQKR